MKKHVCTVLSAVFCVCVGALSACASPTLEPPASLPPSDTQAQERIDPTAITPVISPPAASIGSWYDLGSYDAPWLAGDGVVPADGQSVATRVAGWRRASAQPKISTSQDSSNSDDWLALVIVQVASTSTPACSNQQTSLDAINAQGGCLRLRRDADFDNWLQAVQPQLYRWVDDHGWTNTPRAWAGFRMPSSNGRSMEVHVLFDPSLIEPSTRNTTDFILSGKPGQIWAMQLANAVRAIKEGEQYVLELPQFPFAPSPKAQTEATMASDSLSESHPSSHGVVSPSSEGSTMDSSSMPSMAEQVLPEEPQQPQQ